MKTTSWTSIALVTLALPALALTHLPDRPRPVHVGPHLSAAAAEVPAPGPSARLLVTDPHRDPHGISTALVQDLDHVPPGGSVEVSTYWIDSRRILAALTRAHRRGVVVRVVVAGVERARTPGARRLARQLARSHDGSQWVWSDGPARTAGPGILHEKTYRLSRVGLERWVVLTGSYNSADDQDATTAATMLRVSGRRDVWSAFSRIGAAQLRQRPVAHPLREHAGPGWSAYFLPMRAGDPDPALRRLRSIPAARTTDVRIAMFSMWGERAEALAAELARLVRGGGRVSLLAGPTVDPAVRERLRASGVRVLPGCWPDGTFVHGKDVATSFVRAGRRERWTWVGSDNWTDRGASHDQAVLGVRDDQVHADFVQEFEALAGRPGGVLGEACPADLDP